MKVLGIDIGSTTCKLVVVNEKRDVLYSDFNRIESEPLEALKKLLEKCSNVHSTVSLIGVTGSARELVGKFLSANVVRSEIICHAVGTLNRNRNTELILEIGGQDSKFISINGKAIDFKMNSVCAAGTGAFLESQANRMGVSLEEFDKLASKSDRELHVDGKCGIFIESSIINYQKLGESRENIANAIVSALAVNYCSYFNIFSYSSENIVFQGGVAKFNSMKNALERHLNKKIKTFSDGVFMGAYGSALIALKEKDNEVAERNLDFHNFNFLKKSIKCHSCDRSCLLVEYSSGSSQFMVGSRCGRY